MRTGTSWLALGGALAGGALAALDGALGPPRLLDGLGVAGGSPAVRWALAAGLGGLLGAALGALWRLSAPEGSPWRAAWTLRQALRLGVEDESALATRARLTAGLWMVALALWVAVPTLAAAHARLFAAVQRPIFAGVAVALVSLGVLVAILLVAVPACSALARGLAAAVRHAPERLGRVLWAFTHPLLHLAGAAALLLTAGLAAAAAHPEAVRLGLVLLLGALLTPLPLLWVARPDPGS